MSYTVSSLYVETGTLNLKLDGAIPSALTLHVGSSQFAITDATLTSGNRAASWSNSGLSWSVGGTVSLSLTGASTTTPTRDADGVTPYWSGTLTAKAVDDGFGCGFRTGQPPCADQLTDATVTYGGTDYTIELLHVAYGGTLQLILSSEPKDSDGSTTERSRMALKVGTDVEIDGDGGAAEDANPPTINVGAKQFLVKDAMVSYGAGDSTGWTKPNAWVLTWTGSGLSWSEDARILLRLVTLPVGGL